MEIKKTAKIHYGWIAALAGTIMISIVFMVGAPIGLFAVPITTELGWSMGSYSLGFTLQDCTAFVCAFLYPFVYRKLKLRGTITLGLVFLCAGAFTISSMNSIALWYVGQICIGTAYGFACYTSVAMVFEKWFALKVGLFLGISHAVPNLCSIIMSPVFASWISDLGWRACMRNVFYIFAVASIIIVLLIRNKPEDMGLKPLFFDKLEENLDSKLLNNDEGTKVEVGGRTLKESMKTVPFWTSLIMIFLVGTLTYPLINSIATFLDFKGIDITTQGLVTSAVLLGTLSMQVPAGILCDKVGGRWAFTIIWAAEIVGVILILQTSATSIIPAYAGSILIGMSMAMMTSPQPLLAGELFGKKNLEVFTSAYVFAMNAGSMCGYPIINYGYELLGSYDAVYLVFAAAMAVAIILTLISTRKKYKFKELTA